MKKKGFILALLIISVQAMFAQSGGDSVPKQTPSPITTQTPKPIAPLSVLLGKNLEQIQKNMPVSRENRENALVSLLEGQRLFWKSVRADTSNEFAGISRQAKQSFQKAIEFDPNLAEAYTAMADVTWLHFRVFKMPQDLEDTISLALISVRLSPNSFGGRHLLAMAYTEKSGLRDDELVPQFADKAIVEWKEVARIDPRNAEAFGFLSLFYERTGKPNEEIEALKKLLAAANPLDPRFYENIVGKKQSLVPDKALLKLAKALITAGRATEAIEYLNRAISDNPADSAAVELLREAIESGNVGNTAGVAESLQQAIFANPKNTALILLLAEIELRNGKTDSAVKVLRDAIAKIPVGEESSAAELQVKLGDIYLETERYTEAVSAFQTALKLRNIEGSIVTEEERVFAMYAYEKIVQSYKNANRLPEAKAAIDKVKVLLGKNDTFADDLLIDFYRETGKRDEALKIVRERRSLNAEDYGLLRLEASVLTELGRVDEAVALIKPLLNKTTEKSSPQYDDFTNYIFIATLYTEAKRGREAIQKANQAFAAARNEEEKQIAKTILASAQQVSGDFVSAEATLRALLKQTPRNPMALNNLGYFLVERNVKLAEALKLIEQAVEIDPTNPSYLDSLGWAYFKLGKFAEAEKYLKSASLLTNSATIFEHLGDVYQKQNKLEFAKSNWRKALNLTSDKAASDRLKLKLNR